MLGFVQRPIEVKLSAALFVFTYLVIVVNSSWPFRVSDIIAMVFGLSLTLPMFFLVYRVYTGDHIARIVYAPVTLVLIALQAVQGLSGMRVQYAATAVVGILETPIPLGYIAIFSAITMLLSTILTFLPRANEWFCGNRSVA
ncbi:MAG: hypothetical protein ACI809_002527 [Candidatus Azotimanducaceae bacterium]|jgi:hypothetical protein